MTAKAIHGSAAGGGEGAVAIELRGRCTLAEVPRLWQTLRPAVERAHPGDLVRVDLSGVEHADGSVVALLDHARRECERRGAAFVVGPPPPSFEDLFRVYADGDEAAAGAPPPSEAGEGLLWRLGRDAAVLSVELRAWIGFVARVLAALPGLVRRPRSAHWRALPALMERAGADAVPIVAVIDFLIGVVTAYEAAIQLRRFGATLYVADLVGASVVRELGPLITAVVVTGRTGAAFAAELGTMSVSDEIDALRAMRVDPIRFLVWPRVFAIVAMLPILTLLGDCVGLLGGMLLASLAIGITGPEYMNETKTIVFASDVFWGVLKSVAFAVAIGFIACQQGLAATGGASGVGKRTTSAVVASLFALILIDAAFAPFFHGHYR